MSVSRTGKGRTVGMLCAASLHLLNQSDYLTGQLIGVCWFYYITLSTYVHSGGRRLYLIYGPAMISKLASSPFGGNPFASMGIIDALTGRPSKVDIATYLLRASEL
jgi:hypothetical protein